MQYWNHLRCNLLMKIKSITTYYSKWNGVVLHALAYKSYKNKGTCLFGTALSRKYLNYISIPAKIVTHIPMAISAPKYWFVNSHPFSYCLGHDLWIQPLHWADFFWSGSLTWISSFSGKKMVGPMSALGATNNYNTILTFQISLNSDTFIQMTSSIILRSKQRFNIACT